MALPTPRSFAQILGEMLETFASRHNIDGIKPGSPILALFEAAAQSDARNAQDIFATLAALDIDRSNGADLDRLGNGEGVPRQTQTYATGVVTVQDNTFTKVAGTVWGSAMSPIPGSTTVYVEAAFWPTTGSLYIGRGSSSVEGPLSFSAAVESAPGVWTVTLSDVVTKSHYAGDEVVLSQKGDRPITSGQVFATVPAAGSTATNFSVTSPVVLLDGETAVYNVPVRCQTAGSVGNVGGGAITAIPNAPFTGCTVTNPTAFSNALDTENDVDYRGRIKQARRSKSKGTIDAIQSAIFGATTSDEAATVLSSSIVRRVGLPDTLYIDDGTGYEPKAAGVGNETILPYGSPSVDRFVLNNVPVAKAAVTTVAAAPFALSAGASLAVSVGGVTSTHHFDVTQFVAQEATAYEIVASINANTGLLFSARTGGSGRFVTITPKAESATIQVTGGTANTALKFPTHLVQDLFLYQDDRLLTNYTLDRNVSQVELGATSSGSLVAGSRFTNGFAAAAAAGNYKAIFDGNATPVFLSIDEGASVRWTFTNGSPFATVEVGLGNFTPALTPFSACKPGDVLVFDSTGMNLPGDWGNTYSPLVTYVPEDGSYVIVECPTPGLEGSVEHYLTTNTNLSVWRTTNPVAQAISLGTDPVEASNSVFGGSVYTRSNQYRAATTNPTGDIAAIPVDGVGGAPQTYASAQPHFAHLESKPGHTPTFSFWHSIQGNSSLTQLSVSNTGNLLADEGYRAFAAQVGRPMPYEDTPDNFLSLYRQGFSAGRILEITGYVGQDLYYRSEVGNSPASPWDGTMREGVYNSFGDATEPVPSWGSTLSLMRYFNFHPKDTVQVSVDARNPGTVVPLYYEVRGTGSYSDILTPVTPTLGTINTAFGTEFDFGGFAVHQRPKALLDVRNVGGTIGTVGSVLVAAPLASGTVRAAIAGAKAVGDAAQADIETTTGDYVIKHRLATGTPIAPAVPGDEAYHVAVVAGPTAWSRKMVFQYAWQVVSAARATNVTTIQFAKGIWATNPFASTTSVYITLNNGSFVDSISPQTVTATGASGANWTVSFSDPGADVGSTAITNGWISTAWIAPATTPANFSELSTNAVTGLDWVHVTTPASYAPFVMDDTYPVYTTGAGNFSILVDSNYYGTAQYDTLTPTGPWGTMFTAWGSTTSFTDLAAVADPDFPVLASSVAGFTATRIPYDTRHEYLLGYRTEPTVLLADEVNYVRYSVNVLNQYELHLKNTVAADLAGYYGFASEPLYLVPTTPKNVAEFVSKLSPLSIARTAKGSLVISSETLGSSSGVQVTGGDGNLVSKSITAHPSIRSQFYVDDRSGLVGDVWAKLSSVTPPNKNIFAPAGDLIASGGVVTATMNGSTSACSYSGTMTGPILGGRWYTEPAGDFTGFYWTSQSNPQLHYNSIQPGDWVTIDPGVGSWRPTGSVQSNPTFVASTTLLNGDAARFGGLIMGTPTNVWATYSTQTGQWSADDVMPGARVGHTVSTLLDGNVLVVGGSSNNTAAGATNTAWVVDTLSNTWYTVTMPLPKKLWKHTANTMSNGKVVVVGGQDDTGAASNTWYTFNYNSASPASSTWSSHSRTINAARYSHQAVQVQGNQLFLVGGGTTVYEVLDATNEAAYALGNTTSSSAAGAALIPGTNDVLVMGDSTLSTKSAGRINWVSGAYSAIDPTPDAMRNITAIVVGNTVYCFGYDADSFVGAIFAGGRWSRMTPRMVPSEGGAIYLAAKDCVLAPSGRPELFSFTGGATFGGVYQVSQILSTGLEGANTYAFWVEGQLGRSDSGVAFVEFRRYDSIMVGDTITVTGTVLGAANQRTFTVASVNGSTSFTTTPAMADFGLTTLGSQHRSILVNSGKANNLVRKLAWMGPAYGAVKSAVNGDTRVVVGMSVDAGATYANQNAVGNGWTVVPMGKLEFPTTAAYGIDAYNYHTGLVQEVSRIVYGDPANPAQHPGVVAAGAAVNIEGPQVKRVLVSLQVRGEQSVSVVTAIQSAVAKAVNVTPVGVNVALSDIVSAANGVPGVTSVAVLYPTYTAGTDLIVVQSYEKAMVLSSEDISVVFTGV